MHPSKYLAVTSLVASTAAAVNLFVASFSGTVTTLSLNQDATSGQWLFKETSRVTDAQTSPAWLEISNDVLYVAGDGFGDKSFIRSYQKNEAGELTLRGQSITDGSLVSTTIYNGGKALAVAEFTGSEVASWAIQADGTLGDILHETRFTGPPGSDKFEAESRPHQVIADPDGHFILVPDMGLDLVHVLSINRTTSELLEVDPLIIPAGSGPRHGTFLRTQKGDTYFFLITEFSNTVFSYKVTYDVGEDLRFHISFEEVFSSKILPDGKFLLTSSRNESSTWIPNPDPSIQGNIVSDTMQVWSIDAATGKLSFVQLAPAGGRYARHFSLNRDGTLVAVALQKDSRVVVIERDVATGKLGKFVASALLDGELNTVLWDDHARICNGPVELCANL